MKKEIKYEVVDFSHLVNIGKISNEAMQLHLKLYAGYVANTNLILKKLNELDLSGDNYAKNYPEYNELHRRFGWEFNGMRLHEKFFGLLKSEKNTDTIPNLKIIEEIILQWGSFENWKNDFYNMAKIRGFGWVMLVRDRKNGRLINTWVNEHDAGMMTDVDVIIVVDMLEHAYISDFGTDRVSYMDSIFEHLDWMRAI